MIFYHLSTDIEHDGKFMPRIPQCRHQDQEDSTTMRISVAPTIQDCLTAIPNGGGHLDELNIRQRGYYLVFKIDTEKLGITDDDIVNSSILYQADLVRDADITNEVWIKKSFFVPAEDRFFIKLLAWEETAHDIVPYSIYDMADEKYEGDYIEAFTDIYKRDVPCSIRIQDLVFICEQVKEGDEVSIYFEEDEEKKLVQNYIQEHYEVEVSIEYMDEITFIMRKDSNLRKLFLYHTCIKAL